LQRGKQKKQTERKKKGKTYDAEKVGEADMQNCAAFDLLQLLFFREIFLDLLTL
jgi:hypothetical protein